MVLKYEVTLGVCVRNAEETIKFAIESIIRQNFPHDRMELIIVDGYSTDKTLPIVEQRLAKSDLTARFFSENTGLGFARQLVVDNAQGEFVIWVDGDLVLSEDYVEKQVDFLKSHPSVGIGRARYGIWKASGPIAFLENMPFVVESSKQTSEAPLGICGTEGAIFRLQAMKDAGGFDTAIKGAAEDTELAKRMLRAGWKAYITDAVFCEICKDSIKGLWKQYFWWGQGWHYYFHKNGKPIELLKLSPIGGFFSGVIRFPAAYMLTHRMVLLFLPLHSAFKRVAFCCGVSKSHLDGYGH